VNDVKRSVEDGSITMDFSVGRLGYLRWRESRAAEETEDTALTTTITLLKAERGKPNMSTLGIHGWHAEFSFRIYVFLISRTPWSAFTYPI